MFIRPDPAIKHAYAEAELLELIRGESCNDFMLHVECRAGRWSVSVVDLDSPHRTLGRTTGDSFAAAWLAQPTNLGENDNGQRR